MILHDMVTNHYRQDHYREFSDNQVRCNRAQDLTSTLLGTAHFKGSFLKGYFHDLQ